MVANQDERLCEYQNQFNLHQSYGICCGPCYACDSVQQIPTRPDRNADDQGL